jgi:ribonuclease P protein component
MLLTIKNRADFVAIGNNNIKFHSPTILLLAKKTPEKYLAGPKNGRVIDFCRVGYTVTKAIGGAVIRNKIKRRYREAFRLLYKEYAKNHFDYVVIAKKDAVTADYKKICDDLKFCFKGINRLVKNEQPNSDSGKN